MTNPRQFDRAEAYTMIRAGEKLEVIADHFGVHRVSISQAMKKLGLPASAKAYQACIAAGVEPTGEFKPAITERPQQYSRDKVLAQIQAGPVRYKDLAISAANRDRVGLRKIIDRLTAKGLIRTTYIDRFPYLVAADWTPTQDMLLAILEGRGKPTADGCLLWTGYTDPGRGPMATIGSPAQPTSVRRTIWQIKREPLTFNETIKPSCGKWTCIAYACMEKATRADPAIGRRKTPIHAMNIALGMRKLKSKLTMEIARDIRASAEPADALAIHYGVSQAAINMIRRGVTWKEYGNGLFTGLMKDGMDLPNGRRV